MIHRWVTHGMDEEDAYVEFAHNIFGMTYLSALGQEYRCPLPLSVTG